MEAISKEIKMGHKSYTYPIFQGGHLLETVVHWCNDPKTFKTFLWKCKDYNNLIFGLSWFKKMEFFLVRFLIFFFKFFRPGVVGRIRASNLATWVRFPAGLEILISILGLGVCSVFCPVLSPAVDLIVSTTHSGRSALVYLSSILIHGLLVPPQAPDPRAFGL